MAKGSYYGRKKPHTGRRIILVLALVVVVAAAVAKLSSIGESQGTKEIFERKPIAPGKPVRVKTESANNVKPVPASAVASAAKADNKMTATEDHGESPGQPSMSQRLLAEGQEALAVKDYVTAREKLSGALAAKLPADQDIQVRRILSDIANMWLFARDLFTNDPLCSHYKVVPGDSLAAIGQKYSVPYQLLIRINNISEPKKLPAGKTIKVVHGPFHALVDRRGFIISVYLGDVLVRSYPISIGTIGRDTPTGLWQVKKNTKLVNPEWTDPDTNKKYYPDDPDNPLAERWIGLEGLEGDTVGQTGFGIHGTIEPETIGKPASRGCIRLLNEDVAELFDLLVESKSQVRVVN